MNKRLSFSILPGKKNLSIMVQHSEVKKEGSFFFVIHRMGFN